MLAIILSFCFSIVAVCIFILIRSEWIHYHAKKMICADVDKYERLQSHDWLLWHWFIWDIEKCIKDPFIA